MTRGATSRVLSIEDRGYLAFVAEVVMKALQSLIKRRMWGRGELFHQLVKIGVQAVGLVAIMCLCIGLILAMQTSAQLAKMGSSHFVPGLIFASLIKEMSPLIAAIIVTGRSGSAVAAELGAMKVSNEIEALRVMAIDPVGFLVIPRFWAMVIMMPLLNVFGIYIGLVGGWFYCAPVLAMDTRYYVEQALTAGTGRDVWISVAKSAVFGFLVITTACQRGMAVRGGAEGVGRATTGTVVFSLLSILVADVILNTVFIRIGLSP